MWIIGVFSESLLMDDGLQGKMEWIQYNLSGFYTTVNFLALIEELSNKICRFFLNSNIIRGLQKQSRIIVGYTGL